MRAPSLARKNRKLAIINNKLIKFHQHFASLAGDAGGVWAGGGRITNICGLDSCNVADDPPLGGERNTALHWPLCIWLHSR